VSLFAGALAATATAVGDTFEAVIWNALIWK
jgi:hypothetical protein